MFAGLILLSFSAISQERQLGTWKSFMPYGSSIAVCNAGDKIFSAGINSIFSYEKSTGIVRTYDKSAGLTDIGVSLLAYDESLQALVVVYSNSNIDILEQEQDVYNIPDIKNESTSGTIRINGLTIQNGLCYLCTDMGISVLDISRKEIKSTYVIGNGGTQVRVFGISFDNTSIYAATEQGIKTAPKTAPNLQDFNSWTSLSASTTGIGNTRTKYIAYNGQNLYAVLEGTTSDTLFRLNNNTWTKLYYGGAKKITSMSMLANNVYFTVWNDSATIAGLNGLIDPNGTFSLRVCEQHGRPMGWVMSDGFSWEADLWNGLYRNNLQGHIERIVPAGPSTASVYDIDVANGILYCTSGGVDESWGFEFKPDGAYFYNGTDWTTKSVYTDSKLDTFFTVIATATSTKTNKTYFGSFLAGLAEYNNATGQLEIYKKTNSILEGSVGDTQRTKISCLTADEDGNIWIGNAGATKPIKMISPTGTWREFAIPYSIALVKKMVFDDYGQMWAPVRRNGEGLLVWTYSGTLDNVSDDKSRLLGTGGGAGSLPDAQVFCVAKDKDGNIWAGTNQGIGIFYCPGSVLTNNGCDADQIKVERDGYIGYLFGTESVKAIAVDAANRKWIGTTNGLWLISGDGKDELLRFNVDNSPLPSNQVTDIAIDDESGEVFIATSAGLVSYQGDAMTECEDCDEALVYPNPVKRDYDGPIAIKGLVQDAYVKITDVSGTLIFQGKANGSQMIWDGKGYKGERAKSGVYFVYSSTDLGKNKRVAKIVLVN